MYAFERIFTAFHLILVSVPLYVFGFGIVPLCFSSFTSIWVGAFLLLVYKKGVSGCCVPFC